MLNMSQKSSYKDIKIIPDSEVDERVNFIIKCENQTELLKLLDYFEIKGKQTTFKKIRAKLCI